MELLQESLCFSDINDTGCSGIIFLALWRAELLALGEPACSSARLEMSGVKSPASQSAELRWWGEPRASEQRQGHHLCPRVHPSVLPPSNTRECGSRCGLGLGGKQWHHTCRKVLLKDRDSCMGDQKSHLDGAVEEGLSEGGFELL